MRNKIIFDRLKRAGLTSEQEELILREIEQVNRLKERRYTNQPDEPNVVEKDVMNYVNMIIADENINTNQ
ncbi:MAG: hypothetical protein KJ607_02515 [Bacteroidetes bacterium]|nr:hypothetical protein [Bacteroidota bacterium]